MLLEILPDKKIVLCKELGPFIFVSCVYFKMRSNKFIFGMQFDNEIFFF